MKSPEAALAFISTAFKGLSEGIKKLVKKVDKPGAAREAGKKRKTSPTKPAARAKPEKRAPVRKKIRVHKARKETATDEVLRIIKGHKKGIDTSKLKKETGFADSKLRMIVYRVYKQGKIKRIARGVYVSA